MEHRVDISGGTGVIRWGYRHAADVTTWSYRHGVLQATLANVNVIAMQQTPLTFVVSNAGARPITPPGRAPMQPPADLRRELVQVIVRGAQLTARLAPRR